MIYIPAETMEIFIFIDCSKPQSSRLDWVEDETASPARLIEGDLDYIKSIRDPGIDLGKHQKDFLLGRLRRIECGITHRNPA